MKRLYDVIIIGDGVVSSAIAREMSGYHSKIGVLEKNLGVYYETSGKNSGVVHGRFTYGTGPLKARLCMGGNRSMKQLTEGLDFKFIRCGKVLVGNTAEDMEILKRTIRQGEKSGAAGLESIGKERLHQLVLVMAGEFTMFSANSGIVNPSNYTTALAENAHVNGAAYYFDHGVTGVRRDSRGNYILTTSNGELHIRWVVNSAGLGCSKISGMLGIRGYKVVGSKGDYIILDKRTGPLLPMPVYPVPSNTYMGIHVTNTTGGNVIIGPNVEMVTDFAYYGVLQESMDCLAKSISDLWPCIRKKDYIHGYSGILPKWVDRNGIIQDSKIGIRDNITPRAINLIDIESPGLTATVPIARHAVCLMEERRKLTPGPEFSPVRKEIPCFTEMTEEGQEQMIRRDPDYGQVVCRCEKVTRVEILTATRNPLGVDTMVGTRYKARSMVERYQGGYCRMRIAQMMKEESRREETEVRYARKDSRVFFDRVREEV